MSFRLIFDTSKNSVKNFVECSPKVKNDILGIFSYLKNIDPNILHYFNPKIVDGYCGPNLSFIVPKTQYIETRKMRDLCK